MSSTKIFPAPADRARLAEPVGWPRNGHEISLHLWVRDGDRPAGGDCFLKIGTTLPLLPKTFPKRTATKRVSLFH